MHNKYYRNAFLYSGLLGILILWFGISWSMLRVSLSLFDTRPLSYLGLDPRTQIVFSVSLIVSALLFICFGYYVSTKFHTSKVFLILLVTGQLSQIITGLAPNTGSTKVLHTVAAFTIAFTLPPLMAVFANNQPKGVFRNWCYRLFWLELICFVVGIGLFTLTTGAAPFGEILPAIAFHAWIIFVTIHAARQ